MFFRGADMFTYERLKELLTQCQRMGVETGWIGKTELGAPIPYVFVGNRSGKCVLTQSSIHAREHITSALAAEQIGYALSHPPKKGGIWFLPMVNIDGVRLATEGLNFLPDGRQKEFLLAVNNGRDFSQWKANINAVDLNVNFDARWAKGKSNVFYAAPANYVGKAPFSEAETQALRDFTLKVRPAATLSYHIKGEVIFWKFYQTGKRLWKDYRLAKGISEKTGYRLLGELGSAGGYKDWCIETLGIPAFTVEAGYDGFGYPYPYSQKKDIVSRNAEIPCWLCEELNR